MYEDPEVMQTVIDLYFKETANPTISDLSLHLGFSDRYSFYDYEKKPEFTHTIKKARAKITAWYEQNVFENAAGSIFMLKNLGYSDKQQLEVKSDLKITGVRIVEG